MAVGTLKRILAYTRRHGDLRVALWAFISEEGIGIHSSDSFLPPIRVAVMFPIPAAEDFVPGLNTTGP
jgi:hypothetical protein